MTAAQVMKQLEALGTASIKKVLMNHGAKEPFFGVKIADMKPIQKKIKHDYQLSMDLYATGNSDAMYLAGLIADESKMSKADIQQWAEEAHWEMISEYTVAWVASESQYGWELALEWIESELPHVATAGWATLSGLISMKPNEEIDRDIIKSLLKRVAEEIHEAKNRVRYTMNGFVIAVGSYIPDLTEEAIRVGKSLGKVKVEMGATSCKVPFAPDYIQKVLDKNGGQTAKKKKTVKC